MLCTQPPIEKDTQKRRELRRRRRYIHSFNIVYLINRRPSFISLHFGGSSGIQYDNQTYKDTDKKQDEKTWRKLCRESRASESSSAPLTPSLPQRRHEASTNRSYERRPTKTLILLTSRGKYKRQNCKRGKRSTHSTQGSFLFTGLCWKHQKTK
ncbi:unnamed protein product [Acanthoscelides obtectus]|uniref:Uncharacterized protein n=1 Tax=Acanthoscelides obtectus TaxID=200917 RepID=A0A9P0VTR8_ACAOB|nr:unnamed protein product [Acanthoscelides obtectus]CAK1683072.1 hypothetical protein AOBTE_LOCUS34062 [Acanthoscelides obtectus]